MATSPLRITPPPTPAVHPGHPGQLGKSGIATQIGAVALGFVLAATPLAFVHAEDVELAAVEAQSGDWNPRRPQIQQAQGWLKKLGYNPGPLSGTMTENMRLALRLYQRDNDLSETGRLTRKVFEHLKAKAAEIKDTPPEQPAAIEPPSTVGATQPRTPAPSHLAAPPAGDETAQDAERGVAAELIPTLDGHPTSPSAPNDEILPDGADLAEPEDPAPGNEGPEQVMTGHVATTTSMQDTSETPSDSIMTWAPDQAKEVRTAMIPPQLNWCRSAANGAWLIKDQTGSEFEIILKEDGTVSGPLYPEHWKWRPTDLGVMISYDNGMGQRVTRHGAIKGESTLAGEASDTRGRTWGWTAMRAPDSPVGSCDAKGPA